MIKKHIRRNFWICVGITILVLGIYAFGGFDTLELKAVDFRFQWRGDRPFSDQIAIVAIDEKSIEKKGRFPWPRSFHADLVKRLSEAGAKVVAFDVLFTEPDNRDKRGDALFAKAVEEAGNVVSAFFYVDEIDDNNVGGKPKLPYDALLESSPYIGFVNFNPDHDGVLRRVKMFAIDENEALPSLAVAAYARYLDKGFDEVIDELPMVVSANPYEAVNNLFINFVDPRYKQTYPFYSYVDILEAESDLSKIFKDKIVFVGGTATALFDIKAIPFIPLYEGVNIHANVIDNLIHKNHIREIESYWTFLYIVFVGLLLGWFLPRYNPWIKLIILVAVTGGGVALALWVFSSLNIVIHMVPPLMTGVGCYGALLFYHLVIEEKEKRKIKGSFKQYLSPKIIDVITKDPSKLKLGGEEREVTIFFLDIAGFTTMSETLNPTQLVEVMNQCLTKFSDIILRRDGLINKYIGDCIMAFWNAPANQDRHASLASWAGLECIQAIPELNKTFNQQGLPSIDCRVGINTGTVVVGNMGSKDKFDYTVMGDAVNLASRLEGANKQYHSHIMIAERTFESAKDDIEARDLDLIRVKGKTKPIKVFELLSKKGELPEEISKGRSIYHNALHEYRQRNFEDALHTFQEVFDYMPNDHLARVYMERARQFTISPPPPQWDGVWVMKTK